jgi:hypothetical protein
MHTHRVQQAKLPPVLMQAEADQLVQQVNQKNAELNSLNAAVDFQASVGGAIKGTVTDYTSLSGFILLRKPEDVHVFGLVPVLRTRAFELASDGKDFKLLVPPKNKLIEGPDTVTKPSPHALENLRPDVIFEAMIPRRIGPDELVTKTTSNVVRVDPVTHVQQTVPSYTLTVVRQRPHSQELIPLRAIHFSRVDLLPFQVDSFDDAGVLVTEVDYGPFQEMDGVNYPKTITIKRLVDEEYQIVITVNKLIVNSVLTDAQFEVKVPEGVTVQRLE